MLEPEIIRATGDNDSKLLLGGNRRVSFCIRGEGRRTGSCWEGAFVGAFVLSRRSAGASSVGGGAAGNLKLCEKELEAFLVVGS